MVKSLKCLVSGRVQGVFFRAFVRDEAMRLGLNGFVRNVPGGRVEVLAQGTDESLATLVNRLAQGPPLARVSEVDAQWTDEQAPCRDFRIKR